MTPHVLKFPLGPVPYKGDLNRRKAVLQREIESFIDASAQSDVDFDLEISEEERAISITANFVDMSDVLMFKLAWANTDFPDDVP